MTNLETSHFVISGNISDSSFGSVPVLEVLQVQIWRSREFFEEYFTSFTISTGDSYNHKFSVPFDENDDYQLYLKVFYQGQELPYSVTIEAAAITDETIFSLIPGNNLMDIKLEMPVAWVASEGVTEYDLTGQLIDIETQKPYANQNVHILFLSDSVELADFGVFVTNGNGYFPFIFRTNRAIESEGGPFALKCEVLDNEGGLVASVSVDVDEDNKEDKLFVFATSLTIEVPNNSSSITTLASELSFTIETDITDFLTTNSIATLKDIRRAGGLKYQDDLAESESTATIELLDAHSQLELVSNDYELNQFLIDDKGYTSLYKIAEKDRAEFIKDTESYGSSAYLKLAKIHTAAKTGEQVMRSLHTGMVLKSGATVNGEHIASINPSFQAYHLPKCSCDDCKAAVSPLAYLSDLIEYAVEHLTWTGTYTDKETKRGELQDLFCLKFLQIKNKCSEINNTVCQYRVAIEVLTCYMGHEDVELSACQTTAFASDEKLYLETAYFVLLEQMGTSYSELRDTIKDTTDRQQQLADRLGIVLRYDDTAYNTLVKMFLDPRATSGTSQITGTRLEEIFGLRDYSQDATYSQPAPYINAWKQAYLDALWLEQSHPDYLFDSLSLPIIDPDLIGPDDFRNPVAGAGTTAFDYWIKRRKFLDETVLSDILKEEGVTLTPKGIDLGARTFTLAGSTDAQYVTLGTQIEVSGTNTAINGIYTVSATTANTITVIEPIADDNESGVLVECVKAIAVSVISTSGNKVTINQSSTELDTNDMVTLVVAGANMGRYKVLSKATVGSDIEITFDPSTPLLGFDEFEFAAISYTKTYSVDSIDNTGAKLRVPGDVVSLPGTIDEVVVSGSTGNDGTYTVTSPAYSSTTGLTTFDVAVATSLSSEVEDGTASLAVTGISISAIDPGARTFFVGGPSLEGLIDVSDTITIEAGAGSNDGDYTISAVDVSYSNGKTLLPVDEAIDSDIKTGNVAYLFGITSVGGSNNEILTITSKVLTPLFSVSGEINILIDDDDSIQTFTVLSISDTAGDTEITLDVSSDTGLDNADQIKYTVPIDAIDISGRKLTATGDLVGHLYIGDSFAVSGSSVSANNGSYTILDITPSSGDTIFTVVQALEADDTPIGEISFNKLVNIHKQQPIVSGLFDAMEDNVTYPGSTPTAPWNPSNISIANLSSIKNSLVNGTGASTLEDDIASELNLTRDAFVRMVEIYEKDKQYALYPSAESVSDDEWQEFYDILLSSVKRTFNSTWITEESSVAFDQTNFWFSLQEPIVGSWPKAFDSNIPLIDPQLIDIEQLPGRTAGGYAISLWNDRKDVLATFKNSFAQLYSAQGLDALLTQLLGKPFPGDPIPYSLSTLNGELSSLDPTVIASAASKIEDELGLSLEEFNQILQFRTKYYTSSSNIATDELDRFLELGTTIFKRQQLYPLWVAQEMVDSPANLAEWGGSSVGFRNATNTAYDKYWLAQKAQLPKWRTSPADRSAWQQKLQAVHRLPIIDPDIVQIGEIKDADAYTIWQTRKALLDTRLAEIQNEADINGPDDEAKLEAIYKRYLGLNDFAEFELLDILESTGTIISGHLKQIGLDYSGYRRLLAIYNSAIGGTSDDLLEIEWDEAYAILLQVVKWRTLYATWNAEENTDDISLSPNFFILLPDYYPVNLLGDLEVVPLWRASYTNRRAWTRTLKGAIAQQDTMLEILKAVVSETEDKVLPIIRDALVKALGEEHAPLAVSAQKLTDRFLTDFQVNCCQQTTRVAHSIDVLQRLMWTLHTGVNPELDIPGMVLNAENFDEEWQWLGTYANWRSAMFVFMYPENLLAPELRRDATPKFREIVNSISQASRFTPSDACYFANEYADYFNDVSNMKVDCGLNLNLISKDPDPCSWTGVSSNRDTLLAFGRGPKTKQVYWVNYHKDDTLGELSGWIPLPVFGDITKKVLGAIPYTYENEDFIVVMATAKAKGEPEKLILAKYDLQNHKWDDTLTEFEIPEDFDASTFLMRQVGAKSASVGLVFKSKRGGVYFYELKEQLTDFDFEKAEHIITHSKGKHFILEAFASNGLNSYLILKNTYDITRKGAKVTSSGNYNQLFYRVLGPRDDWEQKKIDLFNWPTTAPAPEAKFQGWVFGSGNTMVMVVSYDSIRVQISLKTYNNSPFSIDKYEVNQTKSNTSFQNGLDNFDHYISRVFGLSLQRISSDNSGTIQNTSLYHALNIAPSRPANSNYVSNLGEEFPEWIASKSKSDKAFEDDWRLLDRVLAEKLVDVEGIRSNTYKITGAFFLEHGWWGTDAIIRLFATTDIDSSETAYLPIRSRNSANEAAITYFPLFTSGPIYNYWKSINYLLPTSSISVSSNHYLVKYTAVSNYFIAPLELNGDDQVTQKRDALDKVIRPISAMFISPHGGIKDSMQMFRQVLNTEVPKTKSQVLGEYLMTYSEEAFYFLPMYLARNLIKNGYYEEALDWLTALYDFRQEDETKRVIYAALQLDDSPSVNELNRNFDNWLLDPLDPHKLGRTRKNAYLKFTVRTIVECLLQYADANFTIDTVESNSKAAELYEQAIVLLNSDIFTSVPAACSELTNETVEEVICLLPAGNKTDVEQLRPAIKDLVDRLGTKALAESALATLKDDMTLDVGEETFDFYDNVVTAINNLRATVSGQPEAPTLADINDHKGDTKETYTWSSSSTVEADAVLERATQRAQQGLVRSLSQITGKTETELEESPEDLVWLNKTHKDEQVDNPEAVYKEGSPLAPASSDQVLMFYETWPNTSQTQMSEYAIPYIPILNQDFCVPANPVYNSLQLWAALNLFKLRNCMNIAGMKRQVDVYAAPTDATSGIPYIGANGQIVLPGSVRIAPTQYRYQYIIQRAKELVSLAQQLEANLLSLFEKKDSESYSLMKAKQDMALARANVKLQDLRIKVSEGEVDLAVLQKERTELQVDGLQGLIDAGLNAHEDIMVRSYYALAGLETALYALEASKTLVLSAGDTTFQNALAKSTSLATAGIVSIVAGGVYASKAFVQAGVNASSIFAAQERRKQEWNFQKTLAEKDVNIGQQGIRVAKDRLRVTGQERQISGLQLSHAEDTVNFLNNKFTNVELYSWMSGVIEGVYAYFLRQATATAKMAQNQLAFERQELPTPFIQDDYWQSPADSAGLSALGDGSSTIDRRGLTGSARLLQDIYKVDQFAFESDKRKLQLAKTFSLSRMAAIEFQRFRETGEITFETMMENFDRDFPGHYLRLIKKVSVSVIALVPPVDGIKATLTSSGISHVVTKGDTYQDTIVRRDPEIIAFTGTQGATGLFELQTDDRFTNPFEGSGVHTRWQLQLPTDTNLFNFDTIADVLITIEYTALHSYDYQQQVLRKLDPEYAAERAISFREELPDQFYELNNPDESDTPMEVSFDISSFDFPAGVKDLYIKSIKVYYVVDDDQRVFFEQQYSGLKTYLQLSGNAINTGLVDATPGKSGLISTESGNGGGYLGLIGKQPQGKWTYKLPNDNLVKKLFADEVIRDVIFIIGFGGTVKPRVNP